LGYFLTAETWTSLGWVSQTLIHWNMSTVDLTHGDWGILVLVASLGYVIAWTWASPARQRELWTMLDERWRARDLDVLASRVSQHLRLDWFRMGVQKGCLQPLAKPELVTHWLRHHPHLLIGVLECIDTPDFASPWVRASALALAQERSPVLDDLFVDLVEGDRTERPSFRIFRALGRHANTAIWTQLMADEDKLEGAKTAWGGRLWIREATDDSLLDTACGRLVISRLGIALGRLAETSNAEREWNDIGGHMEGLILRLLDEFQRTRPDPQATTTWDDAKDCPVLAREGIQGQHSGIWCFEWILETWVLGAAAFKGREDQESALAAAVVQLGVVLDINAPVLPAERKVLADRWFLSLCQSELAPELIRAGVERGARGLVKERSKGIARRLWKHHPWDFGHTMDEEYTARLDALRVVFPESLAT